MLEEHTDGEPTTAAGSQHRRPGRNKAQAQKGAARQPLRTRRIIAWFVGQYPPLEEDRMSPRDMRDVINKELRGWECN